MFVAGIEYKEYIDSYHLEIESEASLFSLEVAVLAS